MTLTIVSSAPTVAQRVLAGIAFMDKNVPGWRSKVDVDSLNIETDCGCIVGQVYGSFNESRKKLFGSYAGAADRGFYAYSHLDAGCADEYALLTAEWKRVLTAEKTIRRRLTAHLVGVVARRRAA